MTLLELLVERNSQKTLKLYATRSMKGRWYWESDALPEGFFEGIKEGDRLMIFKNTRKVKPDDPDWIIFRGRPRLTFDANADVNRAVAKKAANEFEKFTREELQEPYQELLPKKES